jgi:hypothetical protein
MKLRKQISKLSAIGFATFLVPLLAAALPLVACNNGGNGGNGGDGGGGNAGGGGGGGSPPPTCSDDNSSDATADPLDFANNLIASPAPPGDLTPASAPQIVVFGWDDVENSDGIAFVNQLLASITNPDSTKGGATLNPNSCYLEGWANPTPGAYVCGNGTAAQVRDQVTSAGFEIGNHTVDHLESNSTWSGIPSQYKDSMTNSWAYTSDGYGPGIVIDQKTWQDVLRANDAELKNLLHVTSIDGFRAPRLELNDQGLNALKAIGYQHDESLEEILPEGYTDALIALDTAGKKGFNWIPWPYTLDNGSPGIWMQQASGGDKKWVTNYPTGIWEVPVYQVYVPSKDGLGKAIADTMLACDKDCVFPDGTPDDQKKHCFLSDGELNPGDTVKEVTSFDFNTFIYSRMTAAQWLAVMKHTFLARFYGNRAPLTYGAHPIEYTDPYDSFTLAVQANNYGYRNVLNYNKYPQRQQAMKDFVNWIKSDPALSKETFFLSARQLVDYMKHPFDKAGTKVGADAIASPDSNGLFSRLTWTEEGATIKVVDGNSADIVFNVKSVDDDPVTVKAGIKGGALKGVSHFDIKYNSEAPFRIRLLTSDGALSTTVLLAGTGSDRLARVRVKDFFPGPEASPAEVTGAGLVNGDYMNKVTGIAFESAATAVTGAKSFNTHILQLTVHGVSTNDLCTK